jgi:hypothetical protein
MPADFASRMLPGGPTGPRAKVQLAVDKFDANVRTALGGVLRDEELRADGEQRNIAAHERWRALGLRTKAEVKREKARARAADEREAAEQLRADARADADKARGAVVDKRESRIARVEESAAEQKQAVAQVAERTKAEVDKKAKRRRLDVIDDEADALDAEAEALTAADEAQRLADAAAKTKAVRKEENTAITRP